MGSHDMCEVGFGKFVTFFKLFSKLKRLDLPLYFSTGTPVIFSLSPTSSSRLTLPIDAY